MDLETIKEIKKRVHRSAGHGYTTIAQLFSGQMEEAQEKGEEFKAEIDSLIEYLDELELKA